MAQLGSEAWEAATWARDSRRYLRVAAAIAMRSATGELKPWARVTQRELAEVYRVPASVAREAISELTEAGILGYYGGGTTVIARDIVHSHDRTRRTARILDLVALHIAGLETEIITLKTNAGPEPLEPKEGMA